MEKFFNRMGQLGAALLVGGIVLTRFTFVVDGGERAVIFNKIKGVQNKVYGEGMHLMVPLLMVRNYIIFLKACVLTLNILIGPKEIRSQIKATNYSL